jgi:8-oxo-dGTP pyrophosphatase MutT (NUDIX family)
MRPNFDAQPPPSDVKIGMMLLFLGLFADAHRRAHCAGEIFEAIDSRKQPDLRMLGVRALDDAPAGIQLRQQRRDLLGGKRWYAAAARDAASLCKPAHVRSIRSAGRRPLRRASIEERMARQAAVVIGIFRAAPHGIIFVERAAHLRDHPGQIGLPGGRTHPQDADLEQTALRELHEEVGVEPSRVAIVARLPAIRQHINDFEVTPFVAVIETGELRIDADETAGVFVVPLSTVLEEGLREESVEYRGMRVSSLVLDFEHRRIWGLTARILASFLAQWRAGDLCARVSAHLWREESAKGNL